MTRKKVFITRKIFEKALEPLKAIADIEVWPLENPPSHNDLLEKCSDCDGLLTLLTDTVDEEVISISKNLQVISQMAVGFDNIDTHAATRKGIPIGHTPGILTDTCADFTFGLMLAISRRIVESVDEVKSGTWRPWGPEVLTGPDVYGKTLGIIGFGRIGQAVAKRAAGFDMNILYHSRNPKPEADHLNAKRVSLEELLQKSDFVSIHLNLSDQTRGLLGGKEFAKMKDSAILINTARGGVLDSEALITALKSKQIAGAALDVYETEPIPFDSPLLQMDNVIVTPHIASAGITTRQNLAKLAVKNLIAGLKNEKLPHCANPEVYS